MVFGFSINNPSNPCCCGGIGCPNQCLCLVEADISLGNFTGGCAGRTAPPSGGSATVPLCVGTGASAGYCGHSGAVWYDPVGDYEYVPGPFYRCYAVGNDRSAWGATLCARRCESPAGAGLLEVGITFSVSYFGEDNGSFGGPGGQIYHRNKFTVANLGDDNLPGSCRRVQIAYPQSLDNCLKGDCCDLTVANYEGDCFLCGFAATMAGKSVSFDVPFVRECEGANPFSFPFCCYNCQNPPLPEGFDCSGVASVTLRFGTEGCPYQYYCPPTDGYGFPNNCLGSGNGGPYYGGSTTFWPCGQSCGTYVWDNYAGLCADREAEIRAVPVVGCSPLC